MNATDYTVEMVDVASIVPSPENDDIYGEIVCDEQMTNLIDSIDRRGLEEPIIVTADNFILSGHRRYFACCQLKFDNVPIRRKVDVEHDSADDFHRLLTEYNPQRIKTVSTFLKESLLRFDEHESHELLYRHEMAQSESRAEFTAVKGSKHVKAVDGRRLPFLEAAEKIIESLRDFWPLNVRQIHYQFLNDPPLTQTCKRSSKPADHWRYRNTKDCYGKSVILLRDARYNGQVDMDVIDDLSRPRFPFDDAFTNVQQFVEQETSRFLVGYHRSPQLDQARHIEVLGEKNTLMQIVKPVCQNYYVPLSLGRGYGSIPVWRDMAYRFRRSGKKRMTLIVLSDWDPEGLDLADDAIRSLRDMFDIPVDYHRVGVTMEQVEHFGLAEDFNPVKETSSKLKRFLAETNGDHRTWELEALPPHYLQDELRAAIEANMNMDIYRQSIAQLEGDAVELTRLRQQLVSEMGL